MMRGWILAAALVGFTAPAVLAQDGTGARYRQQAPELRYAQAAPRYQVDPNFRPAAAAAPTSRPRSPREAAQRTNKRSSGGGSLASRFGLSKLIPKSLRGGDEQQAVDPPMPYDPAELGAQQQRPSQNMQSRQMPARQQAAPRTPQTGRPPQATRTPQVTHAPQASRMPQATPRTQATAPTSRIARSSPTVSARRNELAEALSGLVISNDIAPAPHETESADARDLAPPSADEAEELPSYLRESAPPASRAQAAKPRTAPSPPIDLRDALLGQVDSNSIAKEVAAPAAEAAIEADELADPPMPQPTAPRRNPPRAVVAQAKPATPSPAPRSFPQAPEPAEVLGGIDADESNAAFADEPPVEVKPQVKVTSPSRNPSRANITRGVLFTSRQPIITSNIEGPQQIVVGRQAEYRVTIENKGDVAARELNAAIAAPAGAEVVDAAASNGTVDRGPSTDASGASSEIKWQLYELPPGASQTLTLQLIPRSGREMHLGVQFTHAPVVSQATVVIQEPKLQMEIAGPSDVMFGKSQRYALTISNPGNGAAEDVSIELTPPGGGPDSKVRHKVGTLAAGDSKKIELELTARDAGELKIQAAAMATGDLRTEATKLVMCRKAELQVDWRGPEKKYAGSIATYYLRVRNPGTAPADEVAVQLNLPAGAELVQASEGHAWNADRRSITWSAAGLSAGQERFMQVQCRMSQAGVNKMELSAQTASGDLSDTKIVPVAVEALADLKLEVSDPKGVVPVGDMAVYEIRIKNRGMTAARGVNVVAMFSEGIDPSHVEGGQHAINDGRVAFRTIDSLAAGGETVLKIHAKASQPGTHIFRTEVACEELEMKLAAEETTRFFNEEERWADASTAYADEANTMTR